MTAKEKARWLIQRFELVQRKERWQDELNLFEAKQCALICVDEILNNFGFTTLSSEMNRYWQEVKEEILKENKV